MKKWYKSKTVWFNIITLILGVVELITESFIIPVEIIAFINGLGNLFLRTISGTKLEK